MWVVLAFASCRHPGEGQGSSWKNVRRKRKKPQVSRLGKLQLRTS